MNSKTMKKINQKCSCYFGSVVEKPYPNEEEANKITTDNYKQFINQDKFYFSNSQIFNSSFTEKRTRRKKKLRLNPSKTLDSYNYTDLL